MDKLRKSSVLDMSIPGGLNVSDGDEWFPFQGHSLPSWGAFLKGMGLNQTFKVMQNLLNFDG